MQRHPLSGESIHPGCLLRLLPGEDHETTRHSCSCQHPDRRRRQRRPHCRNRPLRAILGPRKRARLLPRVLGLGDVCRFAGLSLPSPPRHAADLPCKGRRPMKSPRFWIIIVLLTSTIFVLQSRGDVDQVPFSEPLSMMPRDFGSWTAQDIPLTDDTLEVLGKGDFLNRIYTLPPTPGSPAVPPISVFIGYFASQRTGQTMHSPQNCLPGAGWTFDSRKYTEIQDINGKSYKVGEYVISNGDVNQFVIYWYQAHGRS